MTPQAPSFAAWSAVTISTCSRRWPQRATATTPRSATTRSKAATAADTAASPMTWKPAVTSALVHARTCASMPSTSRWQVPMQSGASA
ncbi:Uncharacterised protein [Mycobacterium tuberculosis]|nr:Uncharacterised protein [Mycobacterium tuberculosis]